MLNLRTLGSLNLSTSDGREITPILSQPKRLALLVYLAVAKPGEMARRDTFLSLFWPERDDAHARNALSQGLSFLRKNLPEPVLIGRGTEEVGIAPDLLRVDTVDFQGAIREERWSDALGFYGGDFLHGFYIAEAWGFGEWVEEEREKWREMAAGAAWSLACEQLSRNALVEAERSAQRALSLVWSDETPVRRFVESMAQAGDRAAALQFYEKFSSKLREELEVEPSATTQRVVDAIRRGEIRAPDPAPVLLGAQDQGNGQSHVPDPEAGERREAPTYSSEDPSLPPPGTRETVAVGAGGPETGGPWKLWFWSLTFAAVTCFAAVGVLRLRGLGIDPGPPPPDRPFTVLADVAGNATPEDRSCIGFLLRTGLDVAHVVQTVPAPDVARVLSLMETDPGKPITPELARNVAARLGASTIVVPRLDRLGGSFVFAIRVEDVEDGLLLAEGRGVEEAQEDVLEMVDRVIRQVRRKLGESRAVLAATEPLPQVLTPSLGALKRYRATLGSFSSQDHILESRKLLWEAVALDPAFAMAWQRLSDVYLSFPMDADSSRYAADQVQRFRDRLTEARWADIQLHRRILDDVALWDVAFSEAEQAVRRNRSWEGYYAMRLAGEAGRPDSALNIYFRHEGDAAAEARRFDPEGPYETACNMNHLTWTVSLDRVEEWKSLLDSLHSELPPSCAADLAFYEAQAEAEWDLADSLFMANQGAWRWPARAQWTARQLSAVRGRVEEAHSSVEATLEDPYGVSQTQRSRLAHLFLDLVFELPPHSLPPGKGPMELEGRGKFPVTDFILYGIREGLLGDTAQSKRVARRLTAMRDSATSVTFEMSFEPWFVLLDAAPAFRRRDWPSVIDRLEPMAARIYEPGVGGYLPGAAYLSWWILAEAHEELQRRETAISYLEKYFIRPNHRIDDWAFQGFFRPRARLKLGRLYNEIGQPEEAARHFRAFLDTFNDPDPEFEWMVQEARDGLRAAGR